MDGKADVVTKKHINRSSNEKKSSIKIQRKIHKSQREKQKRDDLNDLFLELGLALEPERQNNGKACLLSDATKILRNLISQVESLRKENASLCAETQYVTAERNDLNDEKLTLRSEVDNLIRTMEYTNRITLSNDAINAVPSTLQPPASVLPLQKATIPPIVGPLYVIPLGQDPNSHPCVGIEAATSIHPPVNRPRARYPNSDSWPEQILLQQTTVTSGRENSNSTTNFGEREDLSPSTELKLSYEH